MSGRFERAGLDGYRTRLCSVARPSSVRSVFGAAMLAWCVMTAIGPQMRCCGGGDAGAESGVARSDVVTLTPRTRWATLVGA